MKNILKFKNDKVKSKEEIMLKIKTSKNWKKILIGVGAGLGLLVGGVALASKGKTESDKDDIYDDEYDAEDEDTTVVDLTESEEV